MKKDKHLVLHYFLWVVIILSLAWANPAAADGIIISVPPLDTSMLSVKYHHVEVNINDQVAITKVDQVFVNESDHELEGMYVFPLPEDAAVSEFALYVDGQRLEGEVLDRAQARRIYEDIVRKRRDPALLEYVGRGAFRARIFPIAPHGEKRVQIEYSQVLKMSQGLVSYAYPLDTERFSAKPIHEVSVHVDIQSKAAIKSVYSPSHDIVVDRQGEHRVNVGFEASEAKPDKDFLLYYGVSDQDVGLNLMTYKPASEDGFFLLLAAPKVEVDQKAVVAKDIVFVLDVSGSMRGEKLAQAKSALKYVLNHLNVVDRFNIVAFSTGIRKYAEGPRPASEKREANAFIEELRAAGGTNIDRALTEALRQASSDRPCIVIFLTDGLATEGVTDTQAIIDHVAQSAQPTTRLFAFGVGDEVNTILLDTIAQSHRGTTAYVRPGQNIEEIVSNFYATVNTPVLADLKLEWGNIQVEEIYPYPLPDLFVGSQLVLVGRYPHGGTTTISLSGEVNGQVRQFTFEGATFRDNGGESFLARLWATRRIGYLLGQIRLHGEDRELVDEIVDLAVKYGIVTPYTSFLVQEDVDVWNPTARAKIATQSVPLLGALPSGPAGAAAVDRAVGEEALRKAQSAFNNHEQVKTVSDKTFIYRKGIWVDTMYDESRMKLVKIAFGSEMYFNILAARPEWGKYFSVGSQVIVVLDGQAYEIVEDNSLPEILPSR